MEDQWTQAEGGKGWAGVTGNHFLGTQGQTDIPSQLAAVHHPDAALV